MEEIWKDVVGAEGKYQVSSIGRVRKTPKINSCGFEYGGGIMSMQSNDYMEYWHLSLRINPSQQKTCFAHVLVAEAFLSPRPAWAECVNHKNGIKTDNRVENLEWSTYSDNVQHQFDTGLNKGKSGEDHSMSKLKESDVREIRRLYLEDTESTSASIAELFGITQSNVSGILTYKNWDHVDIDKKEEFLRKKNEKRTYIRRVTSKRNNAFKSNKLTDAQVQEIRRLWEEEQPITKREIANRFSIHDTTCADIINRKIHII